MKCTICERNLAGKLDTFGSPTYPLCMKHWWTDGDKMKKRQIGQEILAYATHVTSTGKYKQIPLNLP